MIRLGLLLSGQIIIACGKIEPNKTIKRKQETFILLGLMLFFIHFLSLIYQYDGLNKTN